MRDENKTKAQLIDELAELRQRIAELEAGQTERGRANDVQRVQERLLALNRAAAQVHGELDPDRVLETVGDELRKLSLNCFFGLVDDAGDDVVLRHINLSPKVLRATETLTGLRARKFAFAVNASSHFEAVIRDGSVLFEEEPVKQMSEVLSGLTKELASQLAGLIQLGQAISAPLLAGEEIHGVLTVWSDDLTEQDIPAVSVFAQQAATAMETAQLYRDIESERDKLAAIMSGLDEGLDVVSKEYVVKFQNRLLRERFGDLRGHVCYEGYMGRKEPCASCPMVEAIETGETHTAEARGRDGRDYEVVSMPLTNPDGTVDAIEVVRDITERKRAQAEIRKLNQFLRSIIENANVWLDVLDEKANVVIWNKAAEEISGYSREEVVGHGLIWEWLYPDEEYRKEVVAGAMAIIERGDVEEDAETTIRRKDGQTRIISWNSRGLVDEAGNPVGSIALGRDITERRGAEEALRESEEKYRSLVERANDGIGIFQDGVCKYANPRLAQIAGYPVEELIGSRFLELIHPSDAPRLTDRYKRRLAGEEVPLVYEAVIKLKDGNDLHLEINASVITYQGNPADFAILRDITQRKRAQEALRQSEDRLRTFMDGLQGIAFRGDMSFVPIFVHGAAEAITGYTVDELSTGKPRWNEIIHPDDLPTYMSQVHAAPGYSADREYRIVRKDGEIRWVRELVHTVCEEPAEASFVDGVIYDITERKQAEEALRESEEKFRTLAERSPNMIFINKKGKVVYANQMSKDLMGYTREEFYSPDFDFLTIVAPECVDIVTQSYARHMKGEECPPYEYALISKEGQRIDAINATRLISYEGDSAILGVVTDITERTRAEEEIRQRTKELEALNAVAETVSQSLNLEEILNSALDKVLEIMGAEAGGIYVADEARRRLTLKVHRGVSEEFVEQIGTVDLDAETVDRVGELRRVGKLILATELLLKDRGLLKKVATAIAREKLRSYLQVMIRVKESPYGLLVVASRESRDFTAREEEFLSTVATQIGMAIENAGLYDDQMQRVFEMDALRRTTLDITRQLNLDALLESIASRAIQLLRGSAGGLYLYRPERDVLEWAVAIGDGLGPIGTTLARGEGLSGRVWETGKPLVVDDYQHWHGAAPAYAGYAWTAVVGVPVHWGQKFLGVLDVLADRPGAFSQADADLLSLFASQAAIAIENARLYEETRKRAEELALLNRVTTATTSTLDLQEVLQAVAEETAAAFGIDQCAIALLDESGQQLTVTAEYLASGRPSALGDVIPIRGNPATERVIASCTPVAIVDAQKDPLLASVHDLMQKRGTKSLLIVPLVVKGEVIGTIGVDFVASRHEFAAEEIALAQSIAGQAAVAFENARLYEEAETRRAYLETLQEINATLRSTLPSQEVLEMIVRKTAEGLGYVGALITVPDATGERLTVGAVWGRRWTDASLRLTRLNVDQFSLPVNAVENPTVRAFVTGEAQVSVGKPGEFGNGIEPAISPSISHALQGATGAKSAACIPLRVAERSIGVLVVVSPRTELEDEERAMLLGLADQAALAMENARLHEETERRAEELAALHDVSLDVLGELGLPALLETITEQAIDLLGEFAGGLYLYDAESQELELVAAKGLWEDRIGTRLALGEGASGKAAQNGEPFVVMDYVNWEGRSSQFDGVPSFNSLAVPIKRGDALLGALYVNDPRLEREFDEGEIRLATLFANQAAVAIENARLYEQTERKAEELATLYDVSLKVVAEIELAETLQTVVEEAVQLLEADTGAIDLFDPQAEELELITAHGYDQGYTGMRMALGEGLAGKVAQGKQPLMVEDYLHWDGRSPQWEQQETRAALGAPLAIGDELLGVLTVNRQVLRPFDENDLRLATLFANQAAIAIEDARLHEALERRAEELMALHQIGLLLSQSLDPSEVLVAITDSALELFQASDVHAFLYASESEELTFAAASWATGESRDAFKHPRKQGLTANVARTGEPLLVSETKSHPLFVGYDEWRQDMESIGGFPLKRGDRVVGVLNIAFSTPHTFETEELRLATLFANQAAIAIENARLMDEVRTHGTELRRLSGQLINAQEEERRRISQELHDELGQALTAMSINLATMAKELPSELAPVATERLVETSSLVDSTLDQMRELALDLRPSMLDDLGLLPTLRWYVNRYSNRTNIEVEFGAIDLDERLPSDMETVLYRVVQEALTNVARHAEANRVRVHLERKESAVTAFIEDDGKGFDLDEAGGRDAPGRGAGLVGMRERVASVRGSFNVESRPGQGTRLSIEIPLL